MEPLHKNDHLFHGRLTVLENTTAVLAKVIFNYLQALKTRIISHNEDLGLLAQSFLSF